jgi:hypothetical protein
MPADLTLRIAAPEVLLAALTVLLLGTSMARAADPDASPPARVKVAARSVDADPAGFTLGRPVIVTRADLESPLGRVRGLERETGTSGPIREADPAFKAILLTPRDSTGRPAQPILPDVVLTEPEVKPPTAEPDPKQQGGFKLQSHNLSDPVAPTPTAPKQPIPPSATKEHSSPRPSAPLPKQSKQAVPVPARAPAPVPAAAPAPRAPVRTTASAPAPRFGAAEIGATRAFTRF